MASNERRIILVGKIGNGKSSTGNSLIGTQAFDSSFGMTSGTQVCGLQTGFYAGNISIRYAITDTPGLMDTDVKLGTRLLEIQRAVDKKFCPDPHAFLLIFRSDNRLSKDEEFTIDLLRVAFGENVFRHCIVVFTHGNCFKTDLEFKQCWTKSNIMVKLVERCGGRITRIENESSVDPNCIHTVHNVVELIEKMSEKGKIVYRYPFMNKHREVIQEHVKSYDGKGDIQQEMSVLVTSLGKVLNAEVWKVMLVGGTVLAVGAAGVGAAGYGIYVVGGTALEMAASTGVGAAVISNTAAVGGAVATTALSLASKLKFW